MSIWDQKNAEVGANTPGRQSTGRGFDAANSRFQAIQSLPQYTTPQQAQQEAQRVIERPYANIPGFIPGSTLSAPAARDRGLGFRDITINRPSSGLPIIDVGANPRLETGPNSSFINRMIGAAGNVAIGVVEGFSNFLGEVFDTAVIDSVVGKNDQVSLDKRGVPVKTDAQGQQTPIMLPDVSNRLRQGLPARPGTAERIGTAAKGVTAVAGAAFAPVAAESAVAEELPIIGKPIFGTINRGFELLDHGARFVGRKTIDLLPIEQQSKDVLYQPIEDLAGIVGMLAGAKVIQSGGGRATRRVVERLPVSEANKGRILSGVDVAADFSLQPFSASYSRLVRRMEGKVTARQQAGEQVTPEVAKTIVNEAVKETPMPDIQAVMDIPLRSGKVEKLQTNQKLVLQNLIRGRENLNYRTVDSLGISLNTGKPITSRFEWDYKNQRGTIFTTDKVTAVDLAHELGFYVDRQVGAGLSKRLSDVLPEYRTRQDEIAQMLSDYALDRLGGNATHAEISAEVLKIADNIRSEIEAKIGKDIKDARARDFAATFGDVLDSPEARAQSPELAQLAQFTLGDVARKGKNADVTGSAGSREEALSILSSLEQAQKSQIKDVRQNDPMFAAQREQISAQRQSIEERGAVASENFDWRNTVRAIRNSKEFKKEGSLSDGTINGVIMRKGKDYRLADPSEVRKLQSTGWESILTMDEVASANGFETAEDYYTYVTELDADARAISRSSEQKAAHEYLMKNNPNYAKLTEQIDILREQLTGAEDAVFAEKQGSTADAGAVPTQAEAQGTKVKKDAPKEPIKTPQVETKGIETPSVQPAQRIGRKQSPGERQATSKVGQSIARKTVEQKLEDSYGQTASYEKINIKDQAERVTKLINSDLEAARRVMRGEEPLPEGMRAGALIKGLEDFALQTGDADLAFDLANSPLVAETSLYAQEMRLMAERTPDSATTRIRELKKIREEAAKQALASNQNLFDAVKSAKNELREAVKKSRPKKEDWNAFIDSIKCT